MSDDPSGDGPGGESQVWESPVWPTDIRVARDRRALTIAFQDGTVLAIPAELLRVESPSAEVQGHGAGDKTLVPGKAEVAITAVEPVGNYAIRIGFDDGHSTGIYSWRYLHKLGSNADAMLAAYEQALAGRGLSRTT